MSEMRVMGSEGDVKITWDAGVEEEVKIARKTFDKMKAKSYIAFKVKKDGSQGKVIDEFDPDAEKIIMAPQMSGG